MGEIGISALIVGLIGMLWYCPYCMARGICALEDKPTFKEKLICSIPIFNIMYGEKRYFGKIKLCTISVLIMIIAFATRIFIWKYQYNNYTLGVASMAFLAVALLFFLIVNAIFVRTVISDSGAVADGAATLFAILLPYGQYYIGKFLVGIVKSNAKKGDTFKE